MDEASEIDKWCHAHSVALCVAQTNGVFGYIFNDFGNSFVVLDTNGEPPATAMVTSVSQVIIIIIIINMRRRELLSLCMKTHHTTWRLVIM